MQEACGSLISKSHTLKGKTANVHHSVSTGSVFVFTHVLGRITEQLTFSHLKTAPITKSHTLREARAHSHNSQTSTRKCTIISHTARCSPDAKPSAIQHRSSLLCSDILFFVLQKNLSTGSLCCLFIPQGLARYYEAQRSATCRESAFQGKGFIL